MLIASAGQRQCLGSIPQLPMILEVRVRECLCLGGIPGQSLAWEQDRKGDKALALAERIPRAAWWRSG